MAHKLRRAETEDAAAAATRELKIQPALHKLAN